MKSKSQCIFLTILLSLLTIIACKNPTVKASMDSLSEFSSSWNGKTCAIVLTYDDGLHVHLDKVMPTLEARGMLGTFYVHTDSDSFKSRRSEWQAAAAKGHELGNHTVFHPCAGKSKDRDWVNPVNDLDNYSVTQILSEIATASADLSALDGKTERTYAYTCGDTSVLDSSFVHGIEEKFVSARGVYGAYNQKDSLARFGLNAHSMNGHSADYMKGLVDQAIEGEYLLVFLFHGVGGEHDLNVEKAAHDELISYIHKRKQDIWVSTLGK